MPHVTQRPGRMHIVQYTGHDALAQLGDRLDDLHSRTATPVTARRRWLETWVRCYPDYEPWVLAASAPDGRLTAVAPFARRHRRGIRAIVALGHGPSDVVALPAEDAAAAAELGDGVVSALAATGRPWRLTVSQTRVNDLGTQALAERLPVARTLDGEACPTTILDRGDNVRAYVSRNHHQQVRRMRNRLQRDGIDPEVVVRRGWADIMAVLPEVMELCRLRDDSMGRRSRFHDPAARRFFGQVVADHALVEQVELVTLHVEGRLIAHVLSFRDEGAVRMWSCAFDPAWSRYGVGRIANSIALERALGAGAEEFDWMRGVEAYKGSMATHVIPTSQLLGWSSNALRLLTDGPRHARSRAAAHPPTVRAVTMARAGVVRVQQRVRP